MRKNIRNAIEDTLDDLRGVQKELRKEENAHRAKNFVNLEEEFAKVFVKIHTELFERLTYC